MARTSRAAIDGSYLDLAYYVYDGSSSPGSDYIVTRAGSRFRLPDGTTSSLITIWGSGYVSLGPPTVPQSNFLNSAGSSNPQAFPGYFFYFGSDRTAAQTAIFVGQKADQIDIGFADPSTFPTGSDLPRPPNQLALLLRDETLGLTTAASFARTGSGTAAPVATGNYAFVDLFTRIGTNSSETLVVGTVLEGIDGGEGNDLLIGSDSADRLIGGAGSDEMRGFGGNDRLFGGAGDDFLNGDAGTDTLVGGLGNDTYFVDNIGDIVTEAPAEGNDALASSISYTLPAGVSIELMTTGFIAGTLPINLTGNEQVNQIWGNDGANVLNGGAGNDALIGFGGNDTLIGSTGADVMVGNTGDDTYFVDDVGDVVAESPGEGMDSLAASISYTLAAGVSVELMTTGFIAGTAPINLTGNELANQIWGNDGTNVLNGGDGNDALIGFGGSDTLIGGTGMDVMVGGVGDDTYFVDNVGDVVAELSAEGNDTVAASVSYTLPAGVSIELMTTGFIAGTLPINLTGNEQVNQIWGNDGANVLNGGAGNDALIGFGGNDTLIGSTGADVMVGNTGDDTYFVDDVGDVVAESPGEGMDSLAASISYTLAAGVSVELMTTGFIAGTAPINLTGNELANQIWGNDGTNVLNGGDGNDALIGFGGSDTLAFTTKLGPTNVDAVIGFVPGQDRLALDDAVFQGLSPGVLAQSAFVTGSAALDADDRILYDPALRALFFDRDGTGPTSPVQFAVFDAVVALNASDFVVI